MLQALVALFLPSDINLIEISVFFGGWGYQPIYSFFSQTQPRLTITRQSLNAAAQLANQAPRGALRPPKISLYPLLPRQRGRQPSAVRPVVVAVVAHVANVEVIVAELVVVGRVILTRRMVCVRIGHEFEKGQ